MNRGEKIAQIRKQKYFVRGDVAVFAAALLLLGLFVLFAFMTPKEKGDSFYVYYKGEQIFSASLETEAEYIFYVKDGVGVVEESDGSSEYENYNRIVISGGTVRVAEEDCADHTCEHLGARSWGEIICVPHDMRIEIRGKGLETDV